MAWPATTTRDTAMSPETAVLVLWIVWYATWLAAVIFSARTTVQMGKDVTGWPRMLAGIGMVLLFWPKSALPFTQPLWTAPDSMKWGLVGLTAVGFAFCWWARIHLGRLWSGFVTLKEDHHIVDTGPYALVRHPIYSGVMFSALATALMKGTPAALLGAMLLTAGFWRVARLEETFLREQLGAAYDAYGRRVAMLVPGLR